MNRCRVAVLTPPGSAAIATLAVVGDRAWELVRARTSGSRRLPEIPSLERFSFGILGEEVGDEVVVALTQTEPEPWVEIHCHGGARLVRWLLNLFIQDGCEEVPWTALRNSQPATIHDPRAFEPLTEASTVRTASILLDQYHGAFRSAITDILASWGTDRAVERLAKVARYTPLGRHLVEPWRVVVAGSPNVGKSSLMNALAGYQRSIVAPLAGTTRDVVTLRLALDGWPVELADTAGLRDAIEELEAGGIDRARAAVADADLVLWVIDVSDPNPLPPPELTDRPLRIVGNKADLGMASTIPHDFLVSASTSEGVPGLASGIARVLVPDPPTDGTAVPFTPELADAVMESLRLLQSGEPTAAREILSKCLSAHRF